MEQNTAPQSPDPVESNNEVTPPPHKSMLAYIVIGLVILAAGLVGGYYFAQSFKPIANSQTTPSPIPSPEASDEMEGWKVYTNPVDNFTFRYPVSLSLSEIGEPNKNDCVLIKADIAYISVKSSRGSSGGCIQTGRGTFDVLTPVKENVAINGSSYVASGNKIDSSADLDAKKKYLEYLWIEDLKEEGFVIEYGGYYNLDELQKYQTEKQIIKKILSTFQFVDATQNKSSCTSKDASFCGEVDKYKTIISSEDIRELIVRSKETEITCDTSSPFNPYICNGLTDKSKASGYQIGYNQSEGSTLSRGEYEELLTISMNENNYQYVGSSSVNGKGLVVFTDTPKEDLFALFLSKEDDIWKTKLLMLGSVSEDFLKLDSRLLDLVR